MNIVRLALFIALTFSAQAAMASLIVKGKIVSVHAGSDTWYGVRFYMSVTTDTTGGACKTDFVYTEPADSGHRSKVALFTAAYFANKNVSFTVTPGRGGYCQLVEGKVN